MLDLTTKFLEPGETLVCFGDSLTHADPGYVSILQERLPENKVINAGVGGDKTPTALLRFQRDVLDRKPDAISIFLGTNDSLIGRGRWADEPFIAPQTYHDNLVWMISHIRTFLGNKKISIVIPYSPFEADAFGEFGNCVKEYAQKARDAAALMKCRIVPLDVKYDEFRNAAGSRFEKIFTVDGVHPTAELGEFTAQVMLESWNMV